MRVLAGDIGGTKTLLLIAECEGETCHPVLERRYASAAYAGLLPMARELLDAAGSAAQGLHGGCFGVAGPVRTSDADQHARVTNLPWQIDASELRTELGIPRVRLINDFQAIGYGIDALGPADVIELQAGREVARAPRVLIGAGTGLGEGFLTWCGGHYEVHASEGGHVDFAPTDERQLALLRELRQQFGRVSCERVLSGPGLVRIYAYLRDAGAAPEVRELREAMQSSDPAAAITAFALTREDPLASLALESFVRVYGAQAGNLALTLLARGGVYLAGGIAPKIITRLQQPDFLHAFNDKGRMASLTAEMPVRALVNPKVGLYGAAVAAARL
jgi:glucokinase